MNKKIQKTTNFRVDYSMENPSNPDETDWIEKSTYLVSESEYDNNGNLILAKTYGSTGDINEHYKYIYNEKNQMVHEINFFDDIEIVEERFCTYDDSGKIAEEKIAYQEGGENIINYFYDELGNLVKRQQCDVDGNIEELELFEFEGGKLKKNILFNDENKEVSRHEFSYDENGNLLRNSFYSAEANENFVMENFYNEKGIREKSLRYNSKEQLVEKVIYTIDENENISEIIEENTKSFKKTRFTYDQNNNVIKQEEFNNNDELLSNIERTFNDDGKLAESLVFIQNPVENIRQMYASKYEYIYFDE